MNICSHLLAGIRQINLRIWNRRADAVRTTLSVCYSEDNNNGYNDTNDNNQDDEDDNDDGDDDNNNNDVERCKTSR